MRRLLYLTLLAVLVIAVSVTVFGQKAEKSKANKPKDPFGHVDVAEVVLKQIADNHFALDLNWNNDQELAALTYPLKITGKDFTMHYDSVSWGRAHYFTVRSIVPVDSLQQVNVGLLADMGEGKPPLEKAEGTVVTLFYTADAGEKKVDLCDVVVDTIFIYPSNVLFGVTPGATGEIHPEYKLTRMSAEGKLEPCK